MMRGIGILAWRYFVKRKARAIFSVIGVSLGIMLLTISLIMIQSIEASVEQTVAKKYGDHDMEIGYANGSNNLTKSEISEILSIPGIKEGSPIWYPYISDESKGYEELYSQPLYVGIEPNTLKMIANVEIEKGSFPKANEVAISYDLMKKRNLEIGSETIFPFPPHKSKKVKISAILKRNENSTNLALFERNWLLTTTKKPDQATAIYLHLQDRTLKDEIAQKLKKDYPDTRIDTRNYMDKERNNLSGIKPIVQGLIVISLLASVLIVISTLQISIREKQKDLATLQLIGAKSNQLLQLIVFESLLIGIFSSGVGLGLGILLSYVSKDMIEKLMNTPMVAVSIPWGQVLVGSLIAIGLIVLSGLIPGFMARKLSPIVAYNRNLSQGSFLKSKDRRGLVAFILCFVFIGLTVGNYFIKGPVWFYILGGVGFTISLIMGFRSILTGVVHVANLLISLFFKTEGLLVGRNALRQMKKSTQIAGVLMLAISVGCIGTMVLSSILQQAVIDLNKEFPIRYVIKSTERGGSFSTALSKQVEKIKEVKALSIYESSHLLTLNLKRSDFKWQFFSVNGKNQVSTGLKGINILDIKKFASMELVEGVMDQKALQNNGVLITEQTSKNLGYKLGDVIQLAKFEEVFSKSKKYKTGNFKVVGIIKNFSLQPQDDIQMYTDPSVLNKLFGTYETKIVYFDIMTKDSQSKDKLKNNIQTMIEGSFPDVLLYDREEELADLHQQFQQRWFILISVIVTMVILSLLGLFNSMASSLRERIGEFGVLRAMGSTSGQIIRLAIMEGSIIFFAGGVMGVCTGVFLGYSLLHAIEAQIYPFPMVWVVNGILFSPLLGIIATLLPAYWIANQDITKALQQE